MNYNEMQKAKLYLRRFFQILNQMEKQMTSAKVVDNITIYFIRCMIPHHQAAIYMCENLLKYTNYPPLENIANNIIQTQTEGSLFTSSPFKRLINKLPYFLKYLQS